MGLNEDDPSKNDDAQPSTTTVEQVLRAADEAAGVLGPEAETALPDVEAPDEGEDFGTGAYEGRTNAQLQALLKSKGLPSSGTHDELVQRLRG